MCTNYHKSCTRCACAFLRMYENSWLFVKFVGQNKESRGRGQSTYQPAMNYIPTNDTNLHESSRAALVLSSGWQFIRAIAMYENLWIFAKFVGKNKTHTSWENKNNQLVGTNTSSERYKNIFTRFWSRYR